MFRWRSKWTKAAIRIAEKLFPSINDENKIYFSIIPQGYDPDDFILKPMVKKSFQFFEKKNYSRLYYGTHHLKKLINNPFEVSKFEKQIKKICYLIKDETLKKYILENFLEKNKKFNSIQSEKKELEISKFHQKQNYQILNETKVYIIKKVILQKFKLKNFRFYF